MQYDSECLCGSGGGGVRCVSQAHQRGTGGGLCCTDGCGQSGQTSQFGGSRPAERDPRPFPTDHESVLIALLLFFLLVLPAGAAGLYVCYRRESSVLHKWVKGFRKSQEACR